VAGPPATPAATQVPIRAGLTYQMALNSKQDWNVYMEEPAAQLDRFLIQHYRTQYYGSVCSICQVQRNDVKGHLISQNHWKKLWAKLEDTHIPSPQDVVNWEKPWVEVINTALGDYLFNHITGEQKLRESSAPLMNASPVGKVPTSTARQKTVCALDVWVWQRHIEVSAQTLQNVLVEANNPAGASPPLPAPVVTCEVCACHTADMCEHLMSANHYSNLRIRMDYTVPNAKELNTGPWVQQAFKLAGYHGKALAVSFNHLTGQVSRTLPNQPQSQPKSYMATPPAIEHEC